MVLGTIVYCVDAEKKQVLSQINLIDSLPATALGHSHCSQDKLKGFFPTHTCTHDTRPVVVILCGGSTDFKWGARRETNQNFKKLSFQGHGATVFWLHRPFVGSMSPKPHS